MVNKIKKILKEEELYNISFGAVIDDTDEIKDLMINLKCMYIHFEKNIIKLETIDKPTRNIKVTITSQVLPWKISGEDWEFGLININNLMLIFEDIEKIYCENMLCYNTLDYGKNHIVCSALELVLSSKTKSATQKLFIDPSYLLGIKIAGEELKEQWLKNNKFINCDEIR